MFDLTKNMAKEAAAIALYESHARNRQTGNKNKLPSWFELSVAERQGWRYRVVTLVKGEVA